MTTSPTKASSRRILEIKGITIEQFLLADGLPHPYPGQVESPDVYNDYGRF